MPKVAETMPTNVLFVRGAVCATSERGGWCGWPPQPRPHTWHCCVVQWNSGDESKSRAVVKRFLLMWERKSPQPKSGSKVKMESRVEIELG